MSIVHKAYFGDGEYEFRLTSVMLKELEAKTGLGAGALFGRIFARQFRQEDLHETIRCGLIGAGMAPKRAAEMIATYAVDRPLTETYPLATAIAEAKWFGEPNEK
jgi:hypothetical protein